MTLKKNKAGQLVIPAPKPKSEKVWVTFQVERQFRNNLTKMAEKLNLNLSRYFRKKAEDLMEAAKRGKLPADAFSTTDIICSECKTKLAD